MSSVRNSKDTINNKLTSSQERPMNLVNEFDSHGSINKILTNSDARILTKKQGNF